MDGPGMLFRVSSEAKLRVVSLLEETCGVTGVASVGD